jgi:hypothetical protein
MTLTLARLTLQLHMHQIVKYAVWELGLRAVSRHVCNGKPGQNYLSLSDYVFLELVSLSLLDAIR